MRYGIFSDIHSNLEALSAVISAYKKEAIDTYLCIGDVVGYAANPQECIKILEATAQITVAGNHDWAVAGLFSLDYFNPLAKEALIWTKGNLDAQSTYFLESTKLIYQNEDLILVHGTLDNPGEFNYLTDDYTARESFRLMQTNICFVGHTHSAGIFIQDRDGYIHYQGNEYSDIKLENKYIVNVGSVGQPRDRNPMAAYSVYDTEKKNFWIKRIAYDIQATKKKIEQAGLPEFLGQRLLVGR